MKNKMPFWLNLLIFFLFLLTMTTIIGFLKYGKEILKLI